jgi:hypothetical protein
MTVFIRICPSCNYWPLNQADRDKCPKCKVATPPENGAVRWGQAAWGKRAFLHQKAVKA